MNLNVDGKHKDDAYIYLDWNVFKYMKENRADKGNLDNDFYKAVMIAKSRYVFPISVAHIKDRMRHFSENHRSQVEEDFLFVDKICDGKFITHIPPDSDVLGIGTTDVKKCYEEYWRECQETQETSFLCSTFGESKIDLARLDKAHPMYEYLQTHNSILNNTTMSDFLNNVYEEIFDDKAVYLGLRDYIRTFDIGNTTFEITSVNELNVLDKLLYHMGPLLISYKYDSIEKLRKNWKEIAFRFFSLNTKSPEMEQLLMQGYALLDMHPLIKKEQLKKKKNTLDNIIRDGNHCYYASNARFFVSEDEGTRIKSEFLYKVYGIKTKVMSEEEFLKKVTIM